MTVDSGAKWTRAREAFAMPECMLRRPQLARLIATLLHGPIEATFEVDHVDGDYKSNAAYNLDIKPPEVYIKKTKEERTGMGQNLFPRSHHRQIVPSGLGIRTWPSHPKRLGFREASSSQPAWRLRPSPR